jgi:competence protein ComEA
MPTRSRAELAAYAACAVLAVLLGWRALHGGASSGADARTPAASVPAPGGAAAGGSAQAARAGPAALVHVVGAVRRPGVYEVRAGARARDAIELAGGPTGRADLQGVNLAAKVSDAQQVVVPRRAAQGGVTAGPAAAAGSPATASAPAGAPLNLNTATAEQLDTLDGVGPATAQKILEFRASSGGFRSVDDLARVPGIGPKRLAALRERVRV